MHNGKPYEIFTGLDDPDYLPIPKYVKKGKIIKVKTESGKRYDFQYTSKVGLNITIEGLSYQFNPIFWNYAKLISGVLRYGMPIIDIIHLIEGLSFDNESINSWKRGVVRALKRYIPNGTKPKQKIKCPNCGSENLVYQEGCLVCKSCGYSKCG